MRVTVTTLTQEGGHFHFGEHYHLVVRLLFGVLTLLAFAPHLKKFSRELRFSNEDANQAYLCANYCLLMQLIGYLLETTNLLIFSATGSGIGTLEFIGHTFSYMA